VSLLTKGDEKMSEHPDKPVAVPYRRDRRERGSRVGGSIFFPILLIALGIFFILRNLGALPGDTWDVVLSLWPVILIAMGLDSLITRQGVVAPVFFIAIGTVILLNNLDVVEWNVWEVILNLWPVLIIAIGLDILVARRSFLGAILAIILITGILAGALWIMAAQSTSASAVEDEQFIQTLDGAEQAVLIVDPAVASLRIGAVETAQVDADILVRGNLQTNRSGSLEKDYATRGDTGTLNLSHSGFRGAYPTWGGYNWEWVLYVNPRIPVELQVDQGAGSIELDLSVLQVTDLSVDLGIGRTEVIFPEAEGLLNASITGAIGDMVLYIPRDKAVRLTSNTGLAFIDVPDGYSQNGDVYVYNEAGASEDNRVVLSVDQAIGRISIRSR
jgi:hypothetical protein